MNLIRRKMSLVIEVWVDVTDDLDGSQAACSRVEAMFSPAYTQFSGVSLNAHKSHAFFIDDDQDVFKAVLDRCEDTEPGDEAKEIEA